MHVFFYIHMEKIGLIVKCSCVRPCANTCTQTLRLCSLMQIFFYIYVTIILLFLVFWLKPKSCRQFFKSNKSFCCPRVVWTLQLLSSVLCYWSVFRLTQTSPPACWQRAGREIYDPASTLANSLRKACVCVCVYACACVLVRALVHFLWLCQKDYLITVMYSGAGCGRESSEGQMFIFHWCWMIFGSSSEMFSKAECWIQTFSWPEK